MTSKRAESGTQVMWGGEAGRKKPEDIPRDEHAMILDMNERPDLFPLANIDKRVAGEIDETLDRAVALVNDSTTLADFAGDLRRFSGAIDEKAGKFKPTEAPAVLRDQVAESIRIIDELQKRVERVVASGDVGNFFAEINKGAQGDRDDLVVKIPILKLRRVAEELVGRAAPKLRADQIAPVPGARAVRAEHTVAMEPIPFDNGTGSNGLVDRVRGWFKRKK